MPEILQCPQCRQQLRVPGELLGKRVQCPACSYVFLAPVTDSGTPVETAEPAEEVVEPQPARRRSRRQDEDDDFDDWDEEPRYRRRRDLPEHRGGAVLTLGILSIVLGWWCLGLILGPIAWAMGNKDLAAMRAGRLDPDGESLTNAGRICGIIGTILGGFGFCMGLLWLLVMMTAVANGPAPRAWP